ncbi:MAG: hypothetical protein OXP71_12130 [Candidatus Poribacteria bacterium]|nr:hypothetical protein [Candidatus Poribacteria bacterium]
MIYRIAMFTVGLACIALYANAEEQILFVSDRDGNSEIYRYFPGGRPKRLTFDEGPDGHPALSPNGKSMAYVTTINRVSQIAVLDFNTGKRRQLTFSPKNDVHPTWSPDGRRIAFSSNRDGDFDIYIMNRNGTNAINMTDNSPLHDGSPHWSPASQKIVFTSERDRLAPKEVYVLDSQAGNRRRLITSSSFAFNPKWSPNGSLIAYYSTDMSDTSPSTTLLWRVKPDGTELEVLVAEGESNSHPKFSPDGSSIAFVSERNFNMDIYALNLETKELTRLTTHLGYDSHPDWSPDGERLAFLSSRDGNSDVFSMTVNGGHITNLTKSGMNEGFPTWSPDGEKIAFSRLMGDNSVRIYAVDSDGDNEVQLVDLPVANLYPVWSPRGNRLAFVNLPERGDPTHRIYTVDPDGINLQMLYEDLLEPIDEIAWSHDESQIVFGRTNNAIAFLDTETGEVHSIDVPVWNLSSLDSSPDGEDIVFSALKPIDNPVRRLGISIIDTDGMLLRIIPTDLPITLLNLGLSWSPDGNTILVSDEHGIYTLDLDTESVELFIESASYPDWQDPSLPRSVTPQNKLNTIWGEMKTGDTR